MISPFADWFSLFQEQPLLTNSTHAVSWADHLLSLWVPYVKHVPYDVKHKVYILGTLKMTPKMPLQITPHMTKVDADQILNPAGAKPYEWRTRMQVRLVMSVLSACRNEHSSVIKDKVNNLELVYLRNFHSVVSNSIPLRKLGTEDRAESEGANANMLVTERSRIMNQP